MTLYILTAVGGAVLGASACWLWARRKIAMALKTIDTLERSNNIADEQIHTLWNQVNKRHVAAKAQYYRRTHKKRGRK